MLFEDGESATGMPQMVKIKTPRGTEFSASLANVIQRLRTLGCDGSAYESACIAPSPPARAIAGSRSQEEEEHMVALGR